MSRRRQRRRLTDSDIVRWFNRLDPRQLDTERFVDHTMLMLMFLDTLHFKR